MPKTVHLSNFRKIDINIEYEPIIQKYAQECVDILKDTSPDRTGKYKEGWTVDTKKDKKGQWYYCTVWNKTSYQLTHLLENGHLIVNKRGGVGWASRKPHIAKAYRRIRNPLIREIENVKSDVKIE